MPDTRFLDVTPMLDSKAPAITALISERGWQRLSPHDRIGAAYDYVRDEILFGYNVADTRQASLVLADGYGQCNTKATLLMAVLRALGIPCRLHGFTIDKSLQRGIVPELVYWMAPLSILHSWVEVRLDAQWINLEGFILDQQVLGSLQAAFPGRTSLCAYGAGTDCLQAPMVTWQGRDTYIQRAGINADLGIFDSPDAFFGQHQQDLTGVRGWLYRKIIRHWMNRRVAAIRRGAVPALPGGDKGLKPDVPDRVFTDS
ncbi:transglutaminase family protein [Phaeobacter inhibens]|uniref:transglutaminase-like domain-containing protein n=1 Tax=Phaeobacter inhibens TaxID=221822 RepID=UPI0021A87328|nr:transglutaminase family protein [Phaeobacter inhibens]UWR83869.1 transglutaminase family protein [Phaeobacter inhibens]